MKFTYIVCMMMPSYFCCMINKHLLELTDLYTFVPIKQRQGYLHQDKYERQGYINLYVSQKCTK